MTTSSPAGATLSLLRRTNIPDVTLAFLFALPFLMIARPVGAPIGQWLADTRRALVFPFDLRWYTESVFDGSRVLRAVGFALVLTGSSFFFARLLPQRVRSASWFLSSPRRRRVMWLSAGPLIVIGAWIALVVAPHTARSEAAAANLRFLQHPVATCGPDGGGFVLSRTIGGRWRVLSPLPSLGDPAHTDFMMICATPYGRTPNSLNGVAAVRFGINQKPTQLWFVPNPGHDTSLDPVSLVDTSRLIIVGGTGDHSVIASLLLSSGRRVWTNTAVCNGLDFRPYLLTLRPSRRIAPSGATIKEVLSHKYGYDTKDIDALGGRLRLESLGPPSILVTNGDNCEEIVAVSPFSGQVVARGATRSGP